ncbi:Lysocardiolipin acyltransferase 1 [Armadillidium nasatum]|uniref:Lysocardiolipin acyltransferase 1 n=1 Tax=Armadillidium nasatum TaxID=96803 RepID=A0A5N5STU7_9CRUS|nr:Lysocardiolipin acyltransferase 1 [Armadillidium nasatum]
MKKTLKLFYGVLKSPTFNIKSRTLKTQSAGIQSISANRESFLTWGSILLFPEGTNITKSTKRRSDEYGNKNNLPLYDYVLHPRTTGFCFLSQEMMKAQHLDAIYDVTVMYPKTLPETELDLLKGNFPEEVHFFIKRYPIETIPESESELQRWLHDLWDEKERRLQKAYEVGHFSHSKGISMKLNASCLSLSFWIPFIIELHIFVVEIYNEVMLYGHGCVEQGMRYDKGRDIKPYKTFFFSNIYSMEHINKKS